MKTIIISAYLSGVIYRILCTDTIKEFAHMATYILEETVKEKPMNDQLYRFARRVANIYSFVVMIFCILLWPIGTIYNLYWNIRTKIRRIFWIRKLNKIRKEIEEIIEKTN